MAYKLKKYDQAINYYSKAIELNPKCVEYYLGAGFCLHKLDRFVEAISNYKKATGIDPNDSMIFTNIGCSLIEMSLKYNRKKSKLQSILELDQAVDNFNTALKLNPEFKRAIYNKNKAFQLMTFIKE